MAFQSGGHLIATVEEYPTQPRRQRLLLLVGCRSLAAAKTGQSAIRTVRASWRHFFCCFSGAPT
jgi:hypothetical protein